MAEQFPSKKKAEKIFLAKAVAGGAPTSPELPAVTTDDNGKVLKVASGKWAVGTDAT